MIMQLYAHMRMCVYMYLNLKNSRQLECVQLVCAHVRREGRRVGIPANRRAVHAFTVCAGRLSMQWHGATCAQKMGKSFVFFGFLLVPNAQKLDCPKIRHL